MHSVVVCYDSFITVTHHSGYHLRGLGAPAHDWHHHFQNVEYGTNGFLCDRLFGTRLEDGYPKHWKDYKEKMEMENVKKD